MAATASAKRCLLHVHIRKTGGTSLGNVLSTRFADEDCLRMAHNPEYAQRELDGFRYVSGHVDFSFLDRFRQPPFVVTALREPIARVLSVYSYYRSYPDERYALLAPEFSPDAYRRRVQAMQLARAHSLEEMIERAPDLAREHLGNVQTRVLSGRPPDSSDERLDLALAGLERCDVVGLTERLDDTAQWLTRRLGWRELGSLPRVNVSSSRLRQDDLSPRTLDALRDLTALDAELYRHAVDRFAQATGSRTRADDPADPAAGIADAPIAADVSFDSAIAGGGWLGRERVGAGPCFGWIGAARHAWVDLRTTEGADVVVVEIAHAIEAAVLDTLSLSVNGQRLSHDVRRVDGHIAVSSRVPSQVLAVGGGIARVDVAVGRTARPCDLDPGSPDERELSVAVSRVALLPSALSASRSPSSLGRRGTG